MTSMTTRTRAPVVVGASRARSSTHCRRHRRFSRSTSATVRRARPGEEERARDLDDAREFIDDDRARAMDARASDRASETMTSNALDASTSSSREVAETGAEGGFGLPSDVAGPLRTLLASQFILFLGVGALLPALPLYAQSIGLSSSANGLVISAPALAMLVLNLPFGQAADRFGRKPLMLSLIHI